MPDTPPHESKALPLKLDSDRAQGIPGIVKLDHAAAKLLLVAIFSKRVAVDSHPEGKVAAHAAAVPLVELHR